MALRFGLANESVVALSTRGMAMFSTKLNILVPVLGVLIALIEPALAGAQTTPAPIVGAGLPALAIIGGGYWLITKFRGRR